MSRDAELAEGPVKGVRYRNEWGEMVPHPEGQWVHVSYRAKEWALDPPLPRVASTVRRDPAVQRLVEAARAHIAGLPEPSKFHDELRAALEGLEP